MNLTNRRRLDEEISRVLVLIGRIDPTSEEYATATLSLQRLLEIEKLVKETTHL